MQIVMVCNVSLFSLKKEIMLTASHCCVLLEDTHIVTTLIDLSVINIVEMQQLCSWSRLCPYLHVMISDLKKFYISMCTLVRGLFWFTRKKNVGL